MVDEHTFKQLWFSEKTVKEISKQLKVSVSQIGKIKRKLGLPRRKSGPKTKRHYPQNEKSAYLMGIAIGDGNLSVMKNSVYRLRLYCDAKYPKLIEKWQKTCESVFQNKVSVNTSHVTNNCKILTVYSNMLKQFPWKPNKGHKWKQKIQIPEWIFNNHKFLVGCVRGLFESDGCYYSQNIKIKDKSYLYTRASFSNSSQELVYQIIEFLENNEIKFYIYKRKTNAQNIKKTVNYYITINELDKFCDITGFSKKT